LYDPIKFYNKYFKFFAEFAIARDLIKMIGRALRIPIIREPVCRENVSLCAVMRCVYY